MKLKSTLLAALLGAAAFVGLGTGCTSQQYGEHHRHVYTCPMHPEVTQNHSGFCSKCGMALTHTR